MGSIKAFVNVDEATRKIKIAENEAMTLFKSRLKPELDAMTEPLETLDLSGRSWTPEGAETIAIHLAPYVQTVKHLNLADVMVTVGIEDGIRMLATFDELFKDSPLVSLDLSENALGIRVLPNLARMLMCDTLKKVSLQNVGFSHETLPIIVDYISQGSNWESISISRNMLGPEGMHEIVKMFPHLTHIRELDFAGTRPRTEGTTYLINALKESVDNGATGIVSLNLGDCNFDDDALQSLHDTLSQLPDLSYLNLSDCDLDDQGVGVVAAALEQSGAKLKTLIMASSYDALGSWQKLLASQSELECLDIQACSLGLEGIKFVAAGLNDSNAMLQEFYVGENELGPRGASVLCPLLLKWTNTLQVLNAKQNDLYSVGCLKILSPFLFDEGETVLKTLDLSDNAIGHMGAEALLKLELPHLHVLSIGENGFSEDEVALFASHFDAGVVSIVGNDEHATFDDDYEEEEDELDAEEDDEEAEEEVDAEVDVLGEQLSQAQI